MDKYEAVTYERHYAQPTAAVGQLIANVSLFNSYANHFGDNETRLRTKCGRSSNRTPLNDATANRRTRRSNAIRSRNSPWRWKDTPESDALDSRLARPVKRPTINGRPTKSPTLAWFSAEPPNLRRSCQGLALRTDRTIIWTVCMGGPMVPRIRDGGPQSFRR